MQYLKIHQQKGGLDDGSYFHPDFTRFDKGSCLKIKRCKIKSSGSLEALQNLRKRSQSMDRLDKASGMLNETFPKGRSGSWDATMMAAASMRNNPMLGQMRQDGHQAGSSYSSQPSQQNEVFLMDAAMNTQQQMSSGYNSNPAVQANVFDYNKNRGLEDLFSAMWSRNNGSLAPLQQQVNQAPPLPDVLEPAPVASEAPTLEPAIGEENMSFFEGRHFFPTAPDTPGNQRRDSLQLGRRDSLLGRIL